MGSFFVAILVVLLSVQAYSESTSPVIMWSNTRAFQEKITKIDLSSAKSISNVVYHPTADYLRKTHIKPEVLVLFAETPIDTEQSPLMASSFDFKENGGSFPKLANIVENARSSLVLPFVTAEESLSVEVIAELINTLTTNANAYIVEDVYGSKQTLIAEKPILLTKLQSLTNSKKMNSMNVEQLLTQLQNPNWEPLNNGEIDIIVVSFQTTESTESALAADDSVIQQVINSIQSTQYTAFFVTGVENRRSYTRSAEKVEGSRHIRTFDRDHFKVRGNPSGEVTDGWPDSLVEALIVMVPFLLILLIGIYCSCQLQSDLKFDHEKNILKKH